MSEWLHRHNERRCGAARCGIGDTCLPHSFSFYRRTDPDSAKSFGHKKRRNSDTVPPRHIILFCFFRFQDVRLRPFRAVRTIPFSSIYFIYAATPNATSRSTRNFAPCYLRRAKRRAANAAADAAIAAPAAPKPRAAEASFVFANFAGLSAFF